MICSLYTQNTKKEDVKDYNKMNGLVFFCKYFLYLNEKVRHTKFAETDF